MAFGGLRLELGILALEGDVFLFLKASVSSE